MDSPWIGRKGRFTFGEHLVCDVYITAASPRGQGELDLPSARRHRALFLCAELDNGGAERHWASLLPGLVDRGLPVRLVAIKGGGRAYDQLQAQGVHVRALGRRGMASAFALAPLLGEWRGTPSVVVTFGYNAHFLGAVLSRLMRAPHVINWHRQKGWPMNRIERAAVRFAAFMGAGVIAVTEAQVGDLVSLGFDRSRVRVVPNGTIRSTPEAGSKYELRARLGLPTGAFVPVMVARLRPEKRHTDFIEALSQLRDRGHDVLGVIVGDGELEQELRQNVAGADAPVRFAGFQEDPGPWVRASDVVCLTSSHEALPMAIVEAMAAGRPCVATDVGGAADVIEEGASGFLFRPGDVSLLVALLERLALDEPLRMRLGKRGEELWEERFSLAQMNDRYFDYLCAVEGPPATW